jgi:hypothetical protein
MAATVALQFEGALKASAKKAEEDRRKAAAKERQDLQRILAEQLNEVRLERIVLSVGRALWCAVFMPGACCVRACCAAGSDSADGIYIPAGAQALPCESAQRCGFERALTYPAGSWCAQVSAGLHRDLSKVVVDTAREQARAAVNATVNSVTPAVASAVAASLQQELASAAGAHPFAQQLSTPPAAQTCAALPVPDEYRRCARMRSTAADALLRKGHAFLCANLVMV